MILFGFWSLSMVGRLPWTVFYHPLAMLLPFLFCEVWFTARAGGNLKVGGEIELYYYERRLP